MRILSIVVTACLQFIEPVVCYLGICRIISLTVWNLWMCKL